MDEGDDSAHPHRLALRLLVPGGNLSGLVYGTLTAGALLAAEAGRHETVGDLVEAVTIAVVLYWVAHAYAAVLGRRLERPAPLRLSEVAGALRHEASLLAGGAAPVAVLLLAHASGVSGETAVTAAMSASVALLAALEVVAGARAGLRGLRLSAQVPIGALMGLGIFALKIILH